MKNIVNLLSGLCQSEAVTELEITKLQDDYWEYLFMVKGKLNLNKFGVVFAKEFQKDVTVEVRQSTEKKQLFIELLNTYNLHDKNHKIKL